MVDPVILGSGQTYERKHIGWLASHNTDPMTGRGLRVGISQRMCSCGQCAVSTAKVVVHIMDFPNFAVPPLRLPVHRPRFCAFFGLKGAKEVVVGDGS